MKKTRGRRVKACLFLVDVTAVKTKGQEFFSKNVSLAKQAQT